MTLALMIDRKDLQPLSGLGLMTLPPLLNERLQYDPLHAVGGPAEGVHQTQARFMGEVRTPGTPRVWSKAAPEPFRGRRGFHKGLWPPGAVDPQEGAQTPQGSEYYFRGGVGYYRREFISPTVAPGHRNIVGRGGLHRDRFSALRGTGTISLPAPFGMREWDGLLNGLGGSAAVDQGERGMTIAGLGAIPPKGDTRGFSTRDFVAVQKGSPVASTEYGEMAFAHGGDRWVLGSDKYPTRWKWWTQHRQGGRVWGSWGEASLKAGETLTQSNGTTVASTPEASDYIAVWVTLIEVGLSKAEAESTARDEAQASKALTDAGAILATLKQKGLDTSTMEATLSQAQASYDKRDFAAARKTADQVLGEASRLKAIQDQKDLSSEENKVINDPTLTAAQKQELLDQIRAQKDALTGGGDWGAWVRQHQGVVVAGGAALALGVGFLIVRALARPGAAR